MFLMAEKLIYKKLQRDWPGIMQRVEGHPEGLPDFVWSLGTQMGWLEVKDEIWRVRPGQALFLRRWSFSSWVLIKSGAWYHMIPGGAVRKDCSLRREDVAFTATGAGWVMEMARWMTSRAD